MKHSYGCLGVVLLMATAGVQAAGVDTLYQQYRSAGAGPFSVQAGEKFWVSKHAAPKDGKPINCQSCHTQDLTQPGKHMTTGKVIDAMAPSVNAQRLTDIKEMKKWFKRNCKQVLGRECTAQEKGDVLMFLQAQ